MMSTLLKVSLFWLNSVYLHSVGVGSNHCVESVLKHLYVGLYMSIITYSTAVRTSTVFLYYKLFRTEKYVQISVHHFVQQTVYPFPRIVMGAGAPLAQLSTKSMAPRSTTPYCPRFLLCHNHSGYVCELIL